MKKVLSILAAFSLLSLPIQQTISCGAHAYYMVNPIQKDGSTFFVKKDLLDNNNAKTLEISPYWIDDCGDADSMNVYLNKTKLVEKKDEENGIPEYSPPVDSGEPIVMIKPIEMPSTYGRYINDSGDGSIHNITLEITFKDISSSMESTKINVKMYQKPVNKTEAARELPENEINITLDYSKF